MVKKIKHSETKAVEPTNKDDDNSVQEQPKRTLLGWKDKTEVKESESSPAVFRNKEKDLVTCSRRISYSVAVAAL
ncbi:hypothetical protein Dsin_022471 [Dipteronia sinensis]|uniref:Uncharacterized protein n=1 Tax=Dipteronia sinensis TaxID=43782 RepID=A0AAE0A316_9ROSI|nr:hypothetical protein Dsin_022471 [Dipteronia sinensis]